MIASVIDFGAGGDGFTALYLDDDFEIKGDYYHDNIDEYIDGIIHGLTRAGKTVKRINYSVTDELAEKIEQGYDDLPDKLFELLAWDGIYATD